MAKRGIRPYGPGKFNTVIDSHAHNVTLDGGADEELGQEGSEWYGLVRTDQAFRDAVRDEEGDQLTQEEEKMLEESKALIIHERSDGIVEATWFDDLNEAEDEWIEIEEEFEGEEEEEDE